jgi:hypothetical protein
MIKIDFKTSLQGLFRWFILAILTIDTISIFYKKYMYLFCINSVCVVSVYHQQTILETRTEKIELIQIN